MVTFKIVVLIFSMAGEFMGASLSSGPPWSQAECERHKAEGVRQVRAMLHKRGTWPIETKAACMPADKADALARAIEAAQQPGGPSI